MSIAGAHATDSVARPPLGIERDASGVLRLTLLAPPANLLTGAMLDALSAAIVEATDDEVRVVVIAASGSIFCAGHDLKEIRACRGDGGGGRARLGELFGHCADLMMAIETLDKPVIAEVAGLATAAGCQLVASCDIAIAGDRARFGVNGIEVGFYCVTPMVPLSRNVDPKLAADMLMTGDLIDADRALRAGLVSRVAPHDELRAESDRLVGRLLDKPPRVLALGKRAMRRQAPLSAADAYREMTAVAIDNLLMEEADEGIAAFLAKRPAAWKRR